MKILVTKKGVVDRYEDDYYESKKSVKIIMKDFHEKVGI